MSWYCAVPYARIIRRVVIPVVVDVYCAESFNGVTHLEEARVVRGERDALPHPQWARQCPVKTLSLAVRSSRPVSRPTFHLPGKVVVIFKGSQTKELLESFGFSLVLLVKSPINMVHYAGYVGTTVLRHALLDGHEIGPIVIDRLDRAAAGVVCPKCPRREFVYPSRECTAVASANVDPRLMGQISAITRSSSTELAST